jgi:hypothetical protein
MAEELYWSLETKSYKRISANFFNSPDATGEKTEIMSEVRYQDYSFDHSIYYGYDKWEDDAIGALEGAKNLNDTLTEALARAYAAKCTSITRPIKDPLTQRAKKLTDEQAESFCSYGTKLIETYKKLVEVNPEYATLIGGVQTKLSNEYVFLWSELKQADRPEADQFLVADLYDELMLNFAKNMLNSAKPNAIIFCSGDNDTYPLWYAQAKLGVRKDIAVMNTSLMNIPSWILSGKEDYKFELGISDKLYLDSTSELIFIQPSRDGDGVYGMWEIATGLQERSPEFLYTSPESRNISLLVPFKNVCLSYVDGDTLAPIVQLKSRYILKSDLAQMDIIASNLGKRPVYYAQTAVYGNLTDALSHVMLQQGLLVEIINGENKGQLSGDKYYDMDACYQNLCVNYKYGLEKPGPLQVENIAITYVYDFHNLSQAYFEKGDTVKAAGVAEICMNKIPLKIFADPIASYLIGDDLCHSGKLQSGRTLLELTIERMKVAYLTPENEYELDRYNSILSRIITTSEKNGFNDLKADAEELQKKVVAKIPPKKHLEYYE